MTFFSRAHCRACSSWTATRSWSGPEAERLKSLARVRNRYEFEIPGGGDGVPGRRVAEMARPEAGVSHVFVHGYRSGLPYSVYLALPTIPVGSDP